MSWGFGPSSLRDDILFLVCPQDRRTTASFGPLPAFVLTPQQDTLAGAVLPDEQGDQFLLSASVNWVRSVKPQLQCNRGVTGYLPTHAAPAMILSPSRDPNVASLYSVET